MKLNLDHLFKLQDKLDNHIYNEHPELKGQNNLDWKILALQVELGECANEWRGFKKWSNDQEPRTYKTCYRCGGDGVDIVKAQYVKKCAICNETGKVEGNPLLEEYVDCLHFILSIGLDIGVKSFRPTKLFTLTNDITAQFNAVFKLISGLDEVILLINHNHYYVLVNNFLNLGEMLGFTWEQIEQAYLEKNKVNHQRQESGY